MFIEGGSKVTQMDDYINRKNNISATLVYLNRFFGNLLLGDTHELKNRELHITYKD